jgi:hypothetical protein
MRLSRHPILVGVAVFLALRFVVLDRLIPLSVCRDGWPSQSIGLRGACSHHGGVATNWVAVLVTLLSASGGVAIGRWLAFRRDRAAREERMQFERERGSALEPTGPATGRTEASSPPCPLCGSTMRVRVAKKGRFRGRQFWGCSSYPRCRGIRPIQQSADGPLGPATPP